MSINRMNCINNKNRKVGEVIGMTFDYINEWHMNSRQLSNSYTDVHIVKIISRKNFNYNATHFTFNKMRGTRKNGATDSY